LVGLADAAFSSAGLALRARALGRLDFLVLAADSSREAESVSSSDLEGRAMSGVSEKRTAGTLAV
jgi:hypothetical protein